VGNSAQKNECICCYSMKCCKAYNQAGIIIFLILGILQIVSLATSWINVDLQRTLNKGKGDSDYIMMQFSLGGVAITHSYLPVNGMLISNSVYCSYGSSAVPLIDSILGSINSTLCPMMTVLPPLFQKIVIPTGSLTVISVLIMIIWMAYRTTVNGTKRLFRNKCCTQTVSFLLTIIVLGTSIPGFALIAGQFGNSARADFGQNFWTNWGCKYSDYCDNSCYDLQWTCDSSINYDVGLIIALTTFAFYVMFGVYTWIGSWCCSCCCPGVEDEVLSTSTVSVHYTQQSSENSTPLVTKYTLYVHYGEQYPTKLLLSAASLEEFTHGIKTALGITLPFKIAVFDDICQQYVVVSSLQLVPQQATIQLIFN